VERAALAAAARSKRSRARAITARETSARETAEAIEQLVGELGLGLRDAAYLLDASFHRVQQLARIRASAESPDHTS